MPLSEMGKMRKDQCVLKVGERGAVQEIGLRMLSVRYPKTSRGTVQEIVGYDLDPNRDQLQRQELESCRHTDCSCHSVSSLMPTLLTT